VQKETMMTTSSSQQFEIPPQMRALTERSIEQARQAVDGFIAAAHQAATAWEDQTETTRKNAKDISQKMMTFAERNIESSFTFARKLVQATNVDEMMKLHTDYIKTQTQVFSDQVKELGAAAGKAAGEASRPKA
jgi:phasin